MTLILSMKGNGECVCQNRGFSEQECLRHGCCKFDNGEVCPLLLLIPHNRVKYL